MSKKKARSDVARVKQHDHDSWRTQLDATEINDDSSWCLVVMVVETIAEHSNCVSIFNAAAEEGKRKAIRCLNYQKTLATVKLLAKQDLDKSPVIQGVCHHAARVLNENGGYLPTWLMARVIKYLVYRAKEESVGIEKKKMQLEAEIDNEYRIMQTVVDTDRILRRKRDDPAIGKANTRLRARGEEWRDAVYVDDAPLKGPNLYVILTGFHDPDLPGELINAGVPLTCILQIKRPNENLDRGQIEKEISDSRRNRSQSEKLHFVERYSARGSKLVKFWTTMADRIKNPEKYPVYLDIAFLTFCPPDIPTDFGDRYEDLKREMYDKFSYVVYDVYDLYRHHDNYLKSMKVETNIADDDKPRCDMEIYRKTLDDIPQECVPAAAILCAMLLQIEADVGEISISFPPSMENDVTNGENTTEAVTESKDAARSTTTLIEENMKILDRLNNLSVESIQGNEEPDLSDIELVLHADTLHTIVRHSVDRRDVTKPRISRAIDLHDNILRVLRQPRIMALWHEHEALPLAKVNEYSRHLDGIRRCFDVDVSVEEIEHHLHILIFDRMIFDRKIPSSKRTPRPLKRRHTDLWMATQKRNKSLPNLPLNSKGNTRWKSDTNIDYGKSAVIGSECSSLFDLTDPREVLVPGYLRENVFRNRHSQEVPLDEFSDVEPLSADVFLQVLYECLVSFDCFRTVYFEPTDSTLLYFFNNYKMNGVHETEQISSLRTPVSLREFCEYVVEEELDWIGRSEETYRRQTTPSIGRLMVKSAEKYEETMMFRDEHFILPRSLKARDLKRSAHFITTKKTVDIGAQSTVETTSDVKRKKPEKKSRETRKKKRKADRDSVGTSTDQTKIDHPNMDPQLDPDVVYDFIGYDLGRVRVQLTNQTKTFTSADGTSVKLEIDDWLYKTKDLRITVVLRDCALRLFRGIDETARQTAEVFHLTSGTGIIVAFRKLPECQPVDSPERDWREFGFDFRASWPSGLLIQPIIGDGPENPFYIRQSYVTAGTGNGMGEARRLFLRNGTVLKYLEDNRIIVLRPNGDVVTCLAIENKKPPDETVSNADGPKAEPRLTAKQRRILSGSSKPQLPRVIGTDSSITQPDTSSMTQATSSSSMAAWFKVSRYTVLNHDGQQYQVLDDSVVSEHHRLLVRTASDHEVNEKFTRRADGTDMLLNSNGELIVAFPDGTRITTGYRIEKEPVMCDWTEEEILRYFVSNGETDRYSMYSSVLKFSEENFGIDTELTDEMTEILIEDGFVSVLLTCCVEHKNYATVFYDQSAVNCTLSMPDDLRVSISRRGHYEVSMAAQVNLKIEDEVFTFTNKVCSSCDGVSTSTYNFTPDSSNRIFVCTDIFGNMFEIQNDGTTRYYEKTPRKYDSTVHESNKNESNDKETEDENVEDKHHCDHDGQCNDVKICRYRIFAMSRKLTAVEYLHRSIKLQTEVAAVFDNETSVILYPISRRPELRRLITFEPVESRSKAGLPRLKIRPTNFDRKGRLRSTYAIPYNWLFPFGKNGDGISATTHDVPLTVDIERAIPKLLRLRILYGFKEPGGNAVIDLQKALGRYWMSLAHGVFERRSIKRTSPGTGYQLENLLENDLRRFAFGEKTSVDPGIYLRGLERELRGPERKRANESMKFAELLRQRTSKTKELEWYKHCMRMGIMMPYFRNIAGTCFLWIKDCVEEALDVSRITRSDLAIEGGPDATGDAR